ncbi:MAG: GNAT family N-acetyltransferase [Candidatus Zixiibacteriota bacterium]
MHPFELSKSNRDLLARAFKNVTRVDIAIDSVIDGQMGEAFTDNLINPTVFMLRIGPFCYFAGSVHGEGGEAMIRNLPVHSLIMTCPSDWVETAMKIHGSKLRRFPRYSFSSCTLTMRHIKGLLDKSPFRSRIVSIDRDLLVRISTEPDHFLDISTYDSIDDFLNRGMGYCLTDGNTLCGVAYASLISHAAIEVSIYVVPDYRTKGVATALACALIKECLENNREPHWDAANVESCTLAEKLGYTASGTYDAFYLVP